jgi:hypothetical protein
MKTGSLAAAFVCALALFPASRARAGATVKSSKSNSSDREAAASTTGTQPVKTTTVKGSKSNSDRAVSNGTKDPTPAEARFHGNGQNQTREAVSSASGAVTSVDATAKTVSLTKRDGSVIVMDASKLARLPKVGQSVTVQYVEAGGKLSAQSIGVTGEGAPPKPKGKKS